MLSKRAGGTVSNSEHDEFFVVINAMNVGLVRVFAVLTERVDGPIGQFNLECHYFEHLSKL